jgi:acyl-coenzyme A thioesterase PaaI-like protein
MGVDEKTLKEIVEEAVPFFKHIGLRLKGVDRNSVTLSLPPAEFLKNHIGTYYAACIFTVAEACGGAIFALKADPMKYMIILKGFNINFLKPVTDEITCTLRVTDEEMGKVLSIVDEKGKYDWTLPLEVKDAEGRTVASATGIYHIRKLW